MPFNITIEIRKPKDIEIRKPKDEYYWSFRHILSDIRLWVLAWCIRSWKSAACFYRGLNIEIGFWGT